VEQHPAKHFYDNGKLRPAVLGKVVGKGIDRAVTSVKKLKFFYPQEKV